MSGPWEKYAAPAAQTQDAPWAKYSADPAASTQAKPAPVKTVEELPKLAWTDVPGQALRNAGASAGNFIGNIYQAVRHPIDTAGNLSDTVDGAFRKLLPDGGARMDAMYNTNPNNPNRRTPEQQKAQRDTNIAKADATGQFFKDRYGSVDGLKQTLATDPVGAAADLSTVLSGGAALAVKAPAVAGGLRTASRLTNPMSLPGAAARAGLPVLGNAAANIIGGLGTHTGAESIRQAYKAGRAGGSAERSLVDNMRGKVPMGDVLEDAKANIAEMGRQKSAAYRQGMAQVSGDRTVLDFGGIDKAVSDAAEAVSFKGQAKNKRAAEVQQAIAKEVEEWKALDPAEYHTPEGLDALKQRIGGHIESLPFEERTARMAGDKIYHAVKAEIVRQAPVYADTMKAYVDATEEIREIERTLSLGKKASVDTAMRKLQSLTRNNANTNYGNRLDLAHRLEEQGGRAIIPALSGQALSSWTPRGLGSATAGGMGLGGYALGGPYLAAALLATKSPRLMGEVAVAAGKGAAKVRKLSELPRKVATPSRFNVLYQAGREY